MILRTSATRWNKDACFIFPRISFKAVFPIELFFNAMMLVFTTLVLTVIAKACNNRFWYKLYKCSNSRRMLCPNFPKFARKTFVRQTSPYKFSVTLGYLVNSHKRKHEVTTKCVFILCTVYFIIFYEKITYFLRTTCVFQCVSLMFWVRFNHSITKNVNSLIFERRNTTRATLQSAHNAFYFGVYFRDLLLRRQQPNLQACLRHCKSLL